jgi:hypothetical protein
MRLHAPFVVSLALIACGSDSKTAEDGELPNGPWDSGEVLPKGSHEPGDPERGKDILLNGSFMSCGVPWKLWADPSLGALAQGALGGADGTTIEGRHGHNTDLPYTLNAFTTADGAEVVNRNCLGCHGGHFDGELVLGLGNAAADFTTSISEGTPESIPDSALDLLGLTDAEKSNLQKILRFSRVAAERLTMRAVGLNPAEQLTGVLLAHHDQTTLAWSDEPLMPIVEPTDEEGNPIPDARLVSDPPPWWRAHKKHALFYNGMARGDQRGTMALATAVCVDSEEEAQLVDEHLRDIHS